jgi:hypothetical protein
MPDNGEIEGRQAPAAQGGAQLPRSGRYLGSGRTGQGDCLGRLGGGGLGWEKDGTPGSGWGATSIRWKDGAGLSDTTSESADSSWALAISCVDRNGKSTRPPQPKCRHAECGERLPNTVGHVFPSDAPSRRQKEAPRAELIPPVAPLRRYPSSDSPSGAIP